MSAARGGGVGIALGMLARLGACAGFALAVAAILVFAEAVLAAPAWLWLAAAAPVALVLDGAAQAWRRRCRRRLGDEAAVARLVEGRVRGVRGLRALLASWALLLLAVAAARPQWGAVEEEVQRRGVDVMICLDTSRSMLAEDVKPSRLARARLEISSFIDQLGGDRVGLIAFAGQARVLCPLTLDHAAAKTFLELVEPDVIQRPGTALAPALELALRSFQERAPRHSVVLLVTDGEDHEGRAVDAARALAEQGVVVHAIGLGEPEGAPIPVEAGSGVAYLRDEEGNVVRTRLDVAVLEAIAEATGGIFYRASSSDLGLREVASEIARMEQSDLGARTTRLRPERYAWFLVPAFVLLALEAVLPDGGRPWGRDGRATRITRVAAAAAAGRARRREIA